MNAQAIIDLARSKGSNAKNLRDAVHEAIHGLQLGTDDWSRRNLTESFDAAEDRLNFFAWECEARGAEWLACERAGIEYDLASWAAIATLESAKQGMPFKMEDFEKGIRLAKERDAPRLLEQLEGLV